MKPRVQTFRFRVLKPLLTLAIGLIGCTSANPPSDTQRQWVARAVNWQDLSQDVFEELNALRANPALYASYLEAWLPYFNGRLLSLPNQTPLQTQEGKGVVQEAIQYLKKQAPVPILKRHKGLDAAANDHAIEQAGTGATGHEGQDGGHAWDRTERYGTWSGEIGENIAYGNNDARGFILQWLVDDGVSNRGHRIALFEPSWNVVGVATGMHPKYQKMCVMVFTTHFEPK